jgi:branched-chain amino acid transport system ATP-binding protein
LLLVEQDLTEALGIADHVLCLLEGRVALTGTPENLTQSQVLDAYFGRRTVVTDEGGIPS